MGWMGKRGEYGAEALGRWVGISPFAFCADCGQPRKLLRSSSGAKSRGVSQVPASMPTTSSPDCVSGRAATPPTAPRPTITTSVFFRSVATAAAFHREHFVVVRGLTDCRRPHFHPLLVFADRHADARIANQVPSHKIRIAAVVRVAEGALDRVRPDHFEEDRGVRLEAGGDVLFYVQQHSILIR